MFSDSLTCTTCPLVRIMLRCCVVYERSALYVSVCLHLSFGCLPGNSGFCPYLRWIELFAYYRFPCVPVPNGLVFIVLDRSLVMYIFRHHPCVLSCSWARPTPVCFSSFRPSDPEPRPNGFGLVRYTHLLSRLCRPCCWLGLGHSLNVYHANLFRVWSP